MNRGFSKIWIIVIVSVIIAAGILAWQRGWAQKEEALHPLETKKDETTDWKIYKNEDFGKAGIQIKYPQDWKVILTPLSPRTPDLPNISVGFNPLMYSDNQLLLHIQFQKETNPQNLINWELKRKIEKVPIAVVLEEREIIVNSIKAIEVTFRYTNVKDSKVLIKVYIPKDNDVYKITLADKNLFYPLFNQMLSTFRFIGEVEEIRTGL